MKLVIIQVHWHILVSPHAYMQKVTGAIIAASFDDSTIFYA